jgi:hypothetical protein
MNKALLLAFTTSISLSLTACYTLPKNEIAQDPKSPFEVQVFTARTMKRALQVKTPKGPFYVEYVADGIGEYVYVDEREVAHEMNAVTFVPHFDFKMGPYDAAIDVAANVFSIETFKLSIGGKVIYADGFAKKTEKTAKKQP